LCAPHLLALAQLAWPVAARWRATMVMAARPTLQAAAIKDYLVGLLSTPLPMAVFWLLLPDGFRRAALAPERAAVRRLLVVWGLLLLAESLAVLVLAGIGQVRPHYFLPALVVVTLLSFGGLPPGTPSRVARDRFALVIAAGVAGVALVMVGHRAIGAVACARCWAERDYGPVAAGLQETGFRGGTIFADPTTVAGNL